MTELEIITHRLEYLARDYRPEDACKEAQYVCDYRVDDTDECPCQWALKLNPDCVELVEVKIRDLKNDNV